jgi:hypothetical protein
VCVRVTLVDVRVTFVPLTSAPFRRNEGDVEGDVASEDVDIRDTTCRCSTQGAAMPTSLEDTFQSHVTSTRSRVGRSAPSPFRRVVSGSGGPDQAPPDVQIVLVTQSGLELPLAESPRQTARLLEVVSEMAAYTGRAGPPSCSNVADRRPLPVRVDQLFDRVRVIVRRGTSTEGGDTA